MRRSYYSIKTFQETIKKDVVDNHELIVEGIGKSFVPYRHLRECGYTGKYVGLNLTEEKNGW